MGKTSFTDECGTRLMALLAALHEAADDDKRAFIAACVRAMEEHAEGRADDGRALLFIFEQICGLVCPEQPERRVQGSLEQGVEPGGVHPRLDGEEPVLVQGRRPLDARRQEQDLPRPRPRRADRGRQRDGALVAGHIIKLDLPVTSVYEQVWARSANAAAAKDGGASMVVVFRLQGLDGEATEPIVETVDEEGGEEVDPEAEFAIAATVGEALRKAGSSSTSCSGARRCCARECSAMLLKLLQHCCKIATNRRRVLAAGAHVALLRLLGDAFDDEALAAVAERLLLTCESLLEHHVLDLKLDDADAAPAPAAAAAAASEAMEVDEVKVEVDGEWSGFVGVLLRGLESRAAAAAPTLGKPIARLLSLVTRGDAALLDALLGHFEPYTDFDAYDDDPSARRTLFLDALVGVAAHVRPPALAARLKARVLHRGLAGSAAAYLVRHLPAEKGGDSDSAWAEALCKPALPLVLQLLGALAKGHPATQKVLVTPELMARLHALEGQSSSASKAVGALAEALLEALKEQESAAAEVDRLRRATQDSKREAALKKRQKMLKSMGMSTQGGKSSKKVVVSSAAPMLVDALEEEAGHVCVVCGEGESYRPGEPSAPTSTASASPSSRRRRAPPPPPVAAAAAAAMSSALSPAAAAAAAAAGLGEPAPSGRAEQCYSTVTHFNLIHFSCHREAARAERGGKQPKEEWDGATLRNSQTRCNNLLPLRGASVSDAAYSNCVEGWWATLQQQSGRVDAGRCRLVAHDVKLLPRFALQESFSADSRGGGKESNIKLLPYLLQLGSFVLDARSAPQRRSYARALAAFVAGSDAPRPPPTDSVLYFLTLSLLLHSPAEWAAHRVSFLERALQHAGAGESRERVSLTIPNSPYTGPARSPSSRSPAAAAAAAAARSPHLSPADAFALPPASELGGGGGPSARRAAAGGGARRRATPPSTRAGR